jgi:hypothetical protein
MDAKFSIDGGCLFNEWPRAKRSRRETRAALNFSFQAKDRAAS